MKRKLLLLTGLSILSYGLFAQSGITWNAATDVNMMSMYGNQHPRIVLDRSGDPMVLWGNQSNDNAYFAKWNGSNFTTPVIVNTGVPVFAASWAGPDISSHGDTVYVVVKETPETSNPAWIYTSFNGGTSFTGPVQVDGFIADSISRFPVVTTDNTGNPIVAFMKFDGSFANARWVITKSTDFGATFGVDVLGSGWSGGDVCDCCPGQITCSGNTVAMMYRDNDANIRDMWCGISNDAGASFSGGFGMDNPDWMLMMCPSSGPDGVIIGDTLHSVLMSGYTGDNLVYYSKSSIGSMTNYSVNPITGLLPSLNSQNFPRIATDGSAVGIVWKQNIGGQDQLPLLFTNNIGNGFPAAYDTIDLNDITNADIAIMDGSIHIVWEDANTGTVKYRKGTFNSVLGIDDNISNQNLLVYPNPASGIVQLQIANGYNGSAEVWITNLLGKRIYHAMGVFNNGKSTIDISELSIGTYLLELRINNEHFATRIIKN
jgi:hypothetical protein